MRVSYLLCAVLPLKPHGGTWTGVTISTSDYMGWDSDLAVDAAGGVHVSFSLAVDAARGVHGSYYDSLDQNLEYQYLCPS